MNENQLSYIENLLNKWNMFGAKGCDTSPDMNVQVSKNDWYCHWIPIYGSSGNAIFFLSSLSRPGIGFAVDLVSRYVSNSAKAHVVTVKRIIRSWNRTKCMSIVFHNITELIGYSDFDFEGDMNSIKSTSGYLFLK